MRADVPFDTATTSSELASCFKPTATSSASMSITPVTLW